MGTNRSVAALATGLLITLVATGCAGSAGADGEPSATTTTTVTAEAAPAETTTPSPTQAPDPLTTVDTIVVGGTGLSLRRGDAEIVSLPFAGGDLDEQVETLTTVFGSEPVPAVVEGDHCVQPQTRWAWGETYHGTRALHTDEGSLVFLTYDAALTRPDGSEVRIETTDGLAVGEVDDPFRALPEDQKDESWVEFDTEVGGHAYYLYDVVRTTDEIGPEPGKYGALGITIGGVVDRIAAPTSLYDYC